MPRYLVTGATGFIGAELVKQLVGAGHHVTALVRDPSRARLLAALGVELRTGDITDRESVGRAMAGAEAVFHLAAWYKVGVREPQAERINVEGTRHVLETAQEHGVRKTVYASTVAVFGDTGGVLADESFARTGPFLTEYERTKWKAHYEVALPLARQGVPIVVAMPGVVYGPGDTSNIRAALVRVLRGRELAMPEGSALSWTYVEDVARGFIQAMERGEPGESYLLTGPAHTYREAFDLAARIAGVRPPWLHPRPGLMRVAASVMGAVERLGLRGPYSAELLRLLSGVTWIGSSAKAARELGFQARSLEDGWTITIEHELRQLQARGHRPEA